MGIKYGVTIIVEGKNDAKIVRKAMNSLIYLRESNKSAGNLRSCRNQFSIVVTNGTKLNSRLREELDAELRIGNKLLLLADPDKGGEMLSYMLVSEYPEITRVHLSEGKCRNHNSPKNRVGVEFAHVAYIRGLLAKFVK